MCSVINGNCIIKDFQHQSLVSGTQITVVDVTKMGNSVSRAGIETSCLVFQASVLTITPSTFHDVIILCLAM